MITYKDLTVVPYERDIPSKDSQRVRFYVGDPYSNEWRDDFAVQVLEFYPPEKNGESDRERADVILEDGVIGHLFRKSTFWYADKQLSLALGKVDEVKYDRDFVRTGRRVAGDLCPRFEEIVNRGRKQDY